MDENATDKINPFCLSIGKRIREVRQKKGLAQQQVAELVGVSLNTINRIEMGRRTPGADTITRLGEFLGCDPGWLLTGTEGESRRVAWEQVPVLTSLPENFERHPELIRGHVSFPGQPEGSFAVQVPDDAMSPFLREGDFALFRKGPVANGQVAMLVDQWGEIRVRRLRKNREHELYVPENPEHQTLSADDEIRVVGQVVRGIRELKI